jgi:[ribosomal protein S18]-alanine N-acetyltransferase
LSFRLEDMAPGDAAAAEALERLCTPSPWSARAFLDELSNPLSRCRLSRADGRLAGFLVLRHFPSESQVLELGVHPDFRRKGLGRALVDDAWEAAVARGSAGVSLEVRAGNAAAIALYAAAGFVPVGRRARYYEGREDAVLMERKVAGK